MLPEGAEATPRPSEALRQTTALRILWSLRGRLAAIVVALAGCTGTGGAMIQISGSGGTVGPGVDGSSLAGGAGGAGGSGEAGSFGGAAGMGGIAGTGPAGTGGSGGRSAEGLDGGARGGTPGEAGASGGRGAAGTHGAGGMGGSTRPGGGGSTGTGGKAEFAACPTDGAACVIMPLGDSITWGYGSTTGGGYRVGVFSQALMAGKSLTFVGSQKSGPALVDGKPFPQGNEGHSGYSIDDSSKTSGISGALTDDAIATYRPNIILLMIGTNDMHYSIDLPNAPARLGKLLDEIASDAPSALLVVATIIPANGAQNTATQTYNDAIPGVVQARAAEGKHVILVDMYAALKSWSTSIYKDSEHPNDAGYTLMANAWYSAIGGLLQ